VREENKHKGSAGNGTEKLPSLLQPM
jgi:hypothetical protein